MPVDEIERLHFYQRQYLGADDLEAQQTYHRDMRRRHNLGQHTWGIVVGADLIEVPQDGDPAAVNVYITPGLLVDGFGREIVILDPVKLDPALFSGFMNSQHREVWIRYDDQRAGQPKYGWGVCDSNDQFARILETYRVVVEPDPTKLADDIIVSGSPAQPADLPLDRSAPFQEFPDDRDDPLWLLRLGSVNWDGPNSKFIPAAPGKLGERRHYVRLVGREVMAPGDSLLLRARKISSPLPTDPNDPAYMGVTAKVEGTLQVDRTLFAKADVELHGGKLYFRDAAGGDDGVPLWMTRLKGPGGKGTADLRIHLGDGKIGDGPASKARLTIGNLDSAGKAEAVILDVRGDDRIEIPTGVLDFGKQTRQMINLTTTLGGEPFYGIGTQIDTFYFRTHNQYCWFRDGAHADTASDAGGGTVQLRLNSQGLFFGEEVRQMLNLWKEEYGIGVQAGDLYFRSASDFSWFKGGTPSSGQNDPGGGTVLMHLLSNGDLHIKNDLSVFGNLRVSGNQDLLKVKTFDRTFGDDPPDSPHAWTIDYSGEFSAFYTAFVVLRGFNIFGDPESFSIFQHDMSGASIPHHVIVQLTSANVSSATGICYCSRSDTTQEGSCRVSFTLVVMGKGVM